MLDPRILEISQRLTIGPLEERKRYRTVS